MILRFLLVVSCLQLAVYAPYNLYDTDRIFDTGRLQFDCLHYYVTTENIDLRADSSMKQVIEYCIRPTKEMRMLSSEHIIHAMNLTFEQLSHLNVTIEQLLSWSASIDLVEQYLLYISPSNIDFSLSNELFYNCTGPWFGPRCQYSFVTDVDKAFSAIVQTKFNRMKNYQENDVDLSNLTCYERLTCNRGGSHLCLDWREVCNGRIDCIDGGADEAQCLELEINECNENEYRCYNGLCIPKEFWKDDPINPDCLDRSDEPEISSSFDLCFRDPTFRCEEHSCRPGQANFPCGDGQCVVDFEFCRNGRMNLYKKSLLAKDTLAEECRLYLACFALVIHNYEQNRCRSIIQYLAFMNKESHLSVCKKLSQFPTTYALNGHIRFLYSKNQNVTVINQMFMNGKEFPSKFDGFTINVNSAFTDWFNSVYGYPGWSDLYANIAKPPTILDNFSRLSVISPELLNLLTSTCSYNGSSIKHASGEMILNAPRSFFFGPECFSTVDLDRLVYFQMTLPEYVCYDEVLCNYIRPTFRHKKLACRHRDEIKIAKTNDYSEFTVAIKDYFRGCAIPYKIEHDHHLSRHPLLYCCQKSSKCISKHRLLDGIIDCYKGDDEKYESSCSLNHMYRFRCGDKETRCFSPIVGNDICQKGLKDSIHQTYFPHLCNGVENLFPLEIDGKNYTDETDCEFWACDHIYTRCDNVWLCRDGRDEENCIKSSCPSKTFPCVSYPNYTLTCLSFDRVNDGIIDCLGASDELSYCRNENSDLLAVSTFRCWKSEMCLPSSSLCNKISDCPLGDDEKFCENDQPIELEIKNIIFQVFKEKRNTGYFSLETSSVYPPSIKPTHPPNERPTERSLVRRTVEKFDHNEDDEPNPFVWTQQCNRGIYVRTLFDGDHGGHSCFCPPSYYGDTCQYQSQRVSLTLRFSPVDRHSVYAIVVKLIDENGQIDSYEQFTFMAIWGCKMKLNLYLLYSTRPKDISKNYSVRIDAYDKDSLKHNASWHLSVPFAFLPVNRVVTQLVLPVQRPIVPYSCNLTCSNAGQCIKYENTQQFFCQCSMNWTGNQCDIPVDCNECSSDSICVGSLNNQSICVCSSTKAGPRCLLPSLCPLNACNNDGRCVLIDGNVGTNNYICICSEEFYGSKCEHAKRKLDIVLDNIPIPSYLKIFVYTVFNESQPSSLVMVKKLLHDQNTVSLYLSKIFHMVFVKATDDYYLTVVQQDSPHYISTSINPAQRCKSVHELFDSTIMTLPLIRRIKYYPRLCENRTDPWCFFDEFYICLCTLEHYPNCFQFDHGTKLTCKQTGYCQNGASCLQDDPSCPSNTICLCTDCYFGTQCQFYAKGFGITLDDILRYELRPNLSFSDQRLPVKISVLITMLIFVFGMINAIFSCLTFRRKNCQVVGCGLYLYASSITSILTIVVFTLKVWFLVLSDMKIITNHDFLHFGCVFLEPLLKILLYTDAWLNACVAIERAVVVFTGIKFDQRSSKRTAKRVIFVLPLLIMVTFIHEPIHRNLFDDEEEQRTWCVTHYSHRWQRYNSAILFMHFLVPFIINLSSASVIIVQVARQRSISQTQQSYSAHLRKQLVEHKHILISPLALVLLSSPRLIISLISTCIKSAQDPWLYLCGYFISFVPPMLVFIVFVLPSELYSQEFRETIKSWWRPSKQ